MNNPMNHLRLATLAVLWGASFLLIKLALSALTPTQIALTRIVLGAVVLLALCALRGLQLPRDRRLWGHVAVASLFASALPWVLFGIGEQTVDSDVTGVLNATTPLWTMLFGFAVGRESVHPARVAGLLLGFLGTVVIFAPWSGSTAIGWGALACLTAAVSYGIGYVYIGRFVAGREVAPLASAAMQMLSASVFATLALPLGGLHAVHWDPAGLVAVAALGVFGTGLAFAVNNSALKDRALRRLGP